MTRSKRNPLWFFPPVYSLHWDTPLRSLDKLEIYLGCGLPRSKIVRSPAEYLTILSAYLNAGDHSLVRQTLKRFRLERIMIYIFIYFKSECPYNKFTVIERILGNLQNSYIETGAHKVRLKLKYSTKNLKNKSKIPNK